jgi:bisphosphoglycerate-independent phosphoglycerate mutase (AlkP superfamily)
MLEFIEKKEKGNPKANIVEEIFNYYKNELKSEPLTNGTQSDAKYYWLKRDKRFDYLEKDNTCLFSTTKISVERKMMSYYDELDRKKLEEEYLEKEKVENQKLKEEETIIKKLKAKAKRDWPEDYTTQEFWINEQIEAYHYMLTIPNDDKIKKKAQRDWPLDFTTQQFWYNEQIDAKERLK